MLLQAEMIGVDERTARRALDAMLDGVAVGVVISGKLASGKDTVAEQLSARLETDFCLEPAVIHQTSGPIRGEYRQIIDIVAANAHIDPAAGEIASSMGVPYAAALHMAEKLHPVTRDPEDLPDPDERTDLNRYLLIYHADHGRRAVEPEYWTRQFFIAMYRTLAEGRPALLTGCRYPNEIGPAQALGLTTVRLAVSRAVQEHRLWGRDGLEPDPTLLDNPNELALDTYAGFNLIVGNDDELAPTLDTVVGHVDDHIDELRSGRVRIAVA
jgi:hypothetical protein